MCGVDGRRRFDDDDLHVVARRHGDRHPGRHRRLRRSAEQSVLVVPRSARLASGSFRPATTHRARPSGRRLTPRSADAAGVQVPAAAAGPAHADEDAAELVPDEAVDEEVGGRVEREQRVGDGRDAVADGLVVQLDGRDQFLERDSDAQSDVRQLARDEDADDDHQRQGDVLALLVAPRQVAVSASHLPQRADETRVERDEQQQRPDGAKHEVADGAVDDEVPVVESQVGRFQSDQRAAVARVLVDDRLLEEPRHVVEHGRHDDRHDGGARSRYRARGIVRILLLSGMQMAM